MENERQEDQHQQEDTGEHLRRVDDAATAVLNRVFDDCTTRPDGSTKGLHSAICRILITYLPNNKG